MVSYAPGPSTRRRVESPDGDGATFHLATAEDVVLRTQHRYRTGGDISERRWLDVLGVLKVQRPALDRACAGRRADEIGVADPLSRTHEVAGYPA